MFSNSLIACFETLFKKDSLARGCVLLVVTKEDRAYLVALIDTIMQDRVDVSCWYDGSNLSTRMMVRLLF